jgi:serine/threonine protein kinase
MIAPNAIVGGRYRIVRMLGGGGMKLAYAAEDLRLGARFCALAEMVDGFTSQEAQRKAVDAFQREADILAQLSNQHIPQVFDCFSETNHHYLVMEFIDGTTLENELTRSDGKLPADRVLEVALEVLEALRYLHARRPPLLHRDLKPPNLMTTTDGRLKLIDFGIARHSSPTPGSPWSELTVMRRRSNTQDDLNLDRTCILSRRRCIKHFPVAIPRPRPLFVFHRCETIVPI